MAKARLAVDIGGRKGARTALLVTQAFRDSIEMAYEAADEPSLELLKGVVDAPIVRFAFREKLERLAWKPS